MLLNRAESLLMNNAVRSAVQRRFEARRLLEMGGPVSGGRALEVGCGRGVGVELILDVFGAGRVDAFDLDPRMVSRARRRLRPTPGRVGLWVGDVSAIAAPDARYDAVFDFGIVHHVLDWRRALEEVSRVLRPGGRFYAEEVLRALIVHPVSRALFDHPLTDRFDTATFVEGLRAAGLAPLAVKHHRDLVAWVVAEKRERGFPRTAERAQDIQAGADC